MSARESFTEDTVLGGKVRLRQPLEGYRAGLDAALLAAACDAQADERVLEVGCGAGAALLAAAVRRPGARFTGLERDAAMLRYAEENIRLNGLQDRTEARAGDAGQPLSRFSRKAFDAVIANPPFFDNPASLRGPSAARRGAWIADDGLPIWIAFLTKAIRERGTVTLIHRAERLGEILALLGEKAGSFKVRPVHPFPDAPAKRVLVRAVKVGKAPLMLLPPLILHERGGAKHTPQAEAILRGEADLPWG